MLQALVGVCLTAAGREEESDDVRDRVSRDQRQQTARPPEERCKKQSQWQDGHRRHRAVVEVVEEPDEGACGDRESRSLVRQGGDDVPGHSNFLENGVHDDEHQNERVGCPGDEGDAARLHRDDAAQGEEADVLLPIEEMSEAKLLLTDELVSQALRREKAAKREARAARKEERREERHSRHRPQRVAAKGGE